MVFNIKGIFKSIRRIDRGEKQNELNYQEVKKIMENDKNCTLLDVRSPQEYKEGHLSNSKNLPIYDIKQKANNMIDNKENPIIVYCQTGNRSKKAIEILRKMGYRKLYNINGGLDNIN